MLHSLACPLTWIISTNLSDAYITGQTVVCVIKAVEPISKGHCCWLIIIMLIAEVFKANFRIEARLKTTSEVVCSQGVYEELLNSEQRSIGADMDLKLRAQTLAHITDFLKMPPILCCAFANAGTQRGTASRSGKHWNCKTITWVTNDTKWTTSVTAKFSDSWAPLEGHGAW